MRKIYLICPVRKCSKEIIKQLDNYVNKLESDGCKVHYPPRDVDQDQDGIDICLAHANAMKDSNEVHFWWDSESKGSHFDFGMAYMLHMIRGMKFVRVNNYDKTQYKSYGNVLKKLSEK